jgi:hypothetical protein
LFLVFRFSFFLLNYTCGGKVIQAHSPLEPINIYGERRAFGPKTARGRPRGRILPTAPEKKIFWLDYFILCIL